MKIKWWWYSIPFLLLQLPFAFSPSCLWDSAIQEHLYNAGNFDCARKLFFDSGVPLSYYEMLLPAYATDFVALFKIASVLLFFICSIITSKILFRLKAFSDFEIYFISVISFFYPCYQMWQHLIMFPYYVSLFAFTLATLCYLKFRETGRNFYAALSLMLLIVAFNIQSFMVYELALLALVFLFYYFDLRNFFSGISSFFKSNWIFLVLPIIYYAFISFLFPREGLYKDDSYNTLHWNVATVLRELEISLVNATITPFTRAFNYLKTDSISSAIYLAVSVIIVFLISRKLRLPDLRQFSFRLFFISLVLISAALFPYALVGKHVSTHGFETRHSLPAHTPLLIGIAVLFRLIYHYQKHLAIIFITFSFFMFIRQQVKWENRYRKLEAVKLNLQKRNQADIGEVVFITEKNHLWDMDEYLRFYECNMILADAFNNNNRLGINDERYAHNDSLVGSYIDKYLKYKNCLLFNGFNGYSKISEVQITGKPQDEAILFLNSLFVADKKQYYSHFLDVDMN